MGLSSIFTQIVHQIMSSSAIPWEITRSRYGGPLFVVRPSKIQVHVPKEFVHSNPGRPTKELSCFLIIIAL